MSPLGPEGRWGRRDRHGNCTAPTATPETETRIPQYNDDKHVRVGYPNLRTYREAPSASGND